MTTAPGLDAQLRRAGRSPREYELEQRARDEDGGEDVRDQPEEEGRGKPANRPRAELEQERGGDDRRHMRVDNGDEHAVEARRNRLSGALLRRQFFADAL